MKRPFSSYLLIFLLVFQVFSALLGFYMLLLAPSGSVMKIPESMLENSPFNSFFIPGMILLVLLGIFPAIIVFGLLRLPDWRFCEKLNVYKDKKWPWAFSVYFGIILICWIIVEEAMIGGGHLLQTIYSSLGILILIISLLPKTMKYYSR